MIIFTAALCLIIAVVVALAGVAASSGSEGCDAETEERC
jgi:hypothetical protein